MTPIGKWTAEGAVKGNSPSILQRRARVSCRGYGTYLASAYSMSMNQGGTADNAMLFVLDRLFSVEAFFIFTKREGRRQKTKEAQFSFLPNDKCSKKKFYYTEES